MDSNRELVEYLKERQWIKSKRVEQAFLKVDRRIFVLPSQKNFAYEDYPLPILVNQTISAPSIVAIMSESIDAKPGMKVLEIGAGSGYQACILSKIVGARGRVFTTEVHAELVAFARERIAKLRIKNTRVFHRDGSQGLEEKAPFDRILVTAAAPRVPEPLFKQLKEGGKMLLPVGSSYFQDLVLVKKVSGEQHATNLLPVVFVPLVGEHGFKQAG